jgi:hypothetical protein
LVSQLTKKGAVVAFEDDVVMIRINDSLLVKGKKSGSKLFQLNVKLPRTHRDVLKNRQLVLLGEEKDYGIWHRRFMHYSPEIVKKTIAEYLEMDAKVPSDDCPTCVKSKMVYSKQSQVHERQSTKPFEKLHIDGGEFPVKSLSGNFYYVIIRDDYTNYTWISCVDSKAKFITEIKNFLEYVNTQFDSKIGIVCVDNKFTTRQWEKLFELYGIIIEGVETFFPSQNGVVERANCEPL